MKRKILDLGGFKRKGVISVNIQGERDITHDMNKFPYPFKKNSIDGVIIRDTLEHLEKTRMVMDEIHRICRNGASVHIEVPFGVTNNRNPEHLHNFTKYWFIAFDPKTAYGKLMYGESGVNLQGLSKSIFKVERIEHQWVWQRVFNRIPKLIRPRRKRIIIDMKVVKEESKKKKIGVCR